MTIKDWPAEDRPREKLLLRGSASLTDAELLAIFLRTGTIGKSAVDLARDLLTKFGSLKALLDADQEHFCLAYGLGSAKYAQLQAVMEMAKRHFKEIIQRGNALTSPEVTRAYLSAQLRGYSYEVFACLFLDNQHRVIQLDELFRGTIDGASVYPREVVNKPCIIMLLPLFLPILWRATKCALCALFSYMPESSDSRADQSFQLLIWTHNAPSVKTANGCYYTKRDGYFAQLRNLGRRASPRPQRSTAVKFCVSSRSGHNDHQDRPGRKYETIRMSAKPTFRHRLATQVCVPGPRSQQRVRTVPKRQPSCG